MGLSSDIPPETASLGTCLQCGLPVVPPAGVWRHPGEYCCYGCYLLHSITGTSGEEARPTLFLARLGFAAFLAMNAQTFTWALYGEDLPFLFPIDAGSYQTINYVVFVLSLPVYLLLGIPFVRNAFREIRALSPGVDSLIAIGTTSAFLYSTYSTFRGSLSIYYDTAAMVLVLVTFGRYLEATARLKATNALGKLAPTVPSRAHLICDGLDRDVAASLVTPGAHVRILPGEQIPVDGKVMEGESTVDESVLTGEAAAVPKQRGDRVLGGSTNHDGYLRVEATSVVGEMYLSQLHRLVDEILKSRSPSQAFADRIARYFTPAVILLAAGTTGFWWLQSGPSHGLLTGLSVLLIACPCGLGIGATLAQSIGYSQAAHQGIIIKSFKVMEQIGAIKSVFIDKTGTLTQGRPRLEAFKLCRSIPRTEQDVLSLVASVESRSEHPTAVAIKEHALAHNTQLLPVSHFKNLPGVGVIGVVDERGVPVKVSIFGQAQDSAGTSFAEPYVAAGQTMSYVYVGDLFSGLIIVADSLRESAADAVVGLQQLQVSSEVISGDRAEVANQVARKAGITSSRGGLRPAEKVAVVSHARSKGHPVCMVGDGINDAAALAAADVGVTLGSATGFAKSSSAMTILDGDLRKLPWIIWYGRKMMRTIQWNFVWVFLYNIIGIALAMAGQIRPVFAALAMVLSSAMVIVNSGRLARCKK